MDSKIYRKLFDLILKQMKSILDVQGKYGKQKPLSSTAINTFKKLSLSKRLISFPIEPVEQFGSRVELFDQNGILFADIVGLNIDGNMVFFVNPSIGYDYKYQWILVRYKNGKFKQRFKYLRQVF